MKIYLYESVYIAITMSRQGLCRSGLRLGYFGQGNMGKSTKPIGKARAAGQYCITVSRAEAELIEQCIRAKGLDGPSQFWRMLLNQGIGSRLSVVTFFDVVPTGRA